MTKPTTIDAYLANVTGAKRIALDYVYTAYPKR